MSSTHEPWLVIEIPLDPDEYDADKIADALKEIGEKLHDLPPYNEEIWDNKGNLLAKVNTVGVGE